MALSDLDALLGDLEKTCQNGCTEGKKDPAEKKNRLEHRQDESLVNELDVMLSDLAAERYGVEAEANRQRAKAVIRELKANSQEIERRSCEQRPPSASESKWEYQGYGIWETTAEETPRPATRSAASTATRELDDLMSSLNSFKVTSGTAGAASSSGGSLDEMLGDLQQDLDRQGVKTTQKGVCAECRKPIIGQVVTALGKTWHAEVSNTFIVGIIVYTQPYLNHVVPSARSTSCVTTAAKSWAAEASSNAPASPTANRIIIAFSLHAARPAKRRSWTGACRPSTPTSIRAASSAPTAPTLSVVTASTRETARPFARRASSPASRPSAAVATVPSPTATSQLSTVSGIQRASCAQNAANNSTAATSLSTSPVPTARPTITL